MRLRLFFVFLLVVIAGAALAQDTKSSQPAPDAQQKDIKPVPLQDSAKPFNLQDGQTFTLDGKTFHFDKKMLRLVPEIDAMSLNNDCLVMHTIQVARDEKDSDSTHVVNVTNCTPAKRFQMKSAVATPQQK